MKQQNESSSVGAEYAALTGLDCILAGGSTKLPRLRRSNDPVGQWGDVVSIPVAG